MSKQGSNRHPAATRDAIRKPRDGEDGFTGHVYEQRKKLYEERDNPNVAERKTRGE